MQHNVKSLTGFTVGATDGEFGKVEEFYFDDQTWTIRYLIVKTGGWLSDRKVLISPVALKEPDWGNKIFPVNLTKEQIKHSPDIDTEKTVSRQQEIELYQHYGWPFGDAGTGFYGYGGIGMMGMVDSRIPFEEKISEEYSGKHSAELHLRSTRAIKGYQIHAIDGEIGTAEDFIIDDQTWSLCFIVVDTGNWFPGKKVIVSPKWIKGVSWENSSVDVDLPVDAIKNSPEYDSSQPLQEGYSKRLSDYYGKPID